jgi:hypothetical protein
MIASVFTSSVLALALAVGYQAEAVQSRSKTAPAAKPPPEQQAGYDWRAFSSDEGRFTVSFPAEPKLRSGSHTILGHDVPYHLFSAATPTGEYIVSYGQFPVEVSDDQARSLFDAARDGLVQSGRGTVSSETELTLNGRPGRELVMLSTSEPRARITCRTFVVRDRMYQLVVVHPDVRANKQLSQVLDGSAAKFFKSFSLSYR